MRSSPTWSRPRSRPRACAPQDSVDAGRELRIVERLGDVVVGAPREPAHAVGLRRAPGEHDHRQLGIDALREAVRGAQPPAQLVAGRVGQHHVQQQQVAVPAPPAG